MDFMGEKYPYEKSLIQLLPSLVHCPENPQGRGSSVTDSHLDNLF